MDARPPTRRSDYDWFDPSRVIPDTINEFPSFSFILGDLHAHVLALPFTVLALAFALQVALHGPARRPACGARCAEALAAGLAVGMLYAINSWSYPVAAGVLAASVITWIRARRAARATRWSGSGWCWSASFVLILPFMLNFDPEARGIGFVHVRRPFGKWLGDMTLIYGILAWPLLPAFAAPAGRGAAPLALGRLGPRGRRRARLAARRRQPRPGAMVVAVAMAVGIGAGLSPTLIAPARFLWILIAGGAALLLIPEILYLKDAFDGSTLFRMNTVFKAGYQAFLLLGLAAACALPWAGAWLPRRLWTPWAAVAADPAPARPRLPLRGHLRAHRRLRQLAVAGRPEVARGARPPATRARSTGCASTPPATPSSSRPSATTTPPSATAASRPSPAAPTVIGWAGHEVQWQHDVGSRITDVETLYTTTDVAAAKALIDRYGIRYVVVGPIEQTTYGDAGLAKWDQLGRQGLLRRRDDGLGAQLEALLDVERIPSSRRSGSRPCGVRM